MRVEGHPMMHSGEAMAGLRIPRPHQAYMGPTGALAQTTLMTSSTIGGSVRGEAHDTCLHTLHYKDSFNRWWQRQGGGLEEAPRTLKSVHCTMLQNYEDAARLWNAAGVCCIWNRRPEAGPPERMMSSLSHLLCALTLIQGKVLRLWVSSGLGLNRD